MSPWFPSAFRALAALSALSAADGYFFHNQGECRYSSADLKDMEFIDRYYFNKLELLRYNSTLNKYIGYTDIGVKNAERLNTDGSAAAAHADLDTYCKHNAANFFKNILYHTVEPTVEVTTAKGSSERHTMKLQCSAYDFYPEGIKLKWLRNGVEVKDGVTATEELYNGDWYHQIHSYLEFTPQSGETIECQVEHSSLKQPKTYKWDPSVPEGKRNKVIIGASGLVLGLVFSIVGLVYYKKKSTGRILVPSS
ncbi:H-2 class II histocompatibility antigen, E-S beta chain-like [Brienomyrus brachyistius]|uniref:H-2 class II histocompatibility antigen, E-S beta chain-like n=1 Tax=Brienomyrus brachyistius TaxID=42636 RepID=UPI0020B3A9A5|nr:H-2 class II histocompatibility antigen, E-S beta chain-like [Brienomyrus brachyistius]